MRYSELIADLEYWKELSDEEDPEVVVYDDNEEKSFAIDSINPVNGIDDKRAIGILIWT